MIKEEKTTQTVIKQRKFCDECGKEITRGLECCRAYCQICRKDLCESCVAAEESTIGDYRECYCESCYDIKEKYTPVINDLEKEIDRLSELMIMECKTKRKQEGGEG